MQSRSPTKDFNLSKLLVGCAVEPFSELRRKGEDASVGKLDNHAFRGAIIATTHGARLRRPARAASLESGIDLGVSQNGRGAGSSQSG